MRIPFQRPVSPHVILSILLFSFAFLTLQGCAITADEELPEDMTVADIYQAAKEQLNDGNYAEAVILYEKLEARFPYGKYAQRAQLEIAFAYYKDNEPETAILAAERFIKLHPNHPNVDYAYYLRGLASFDAGNSFFEKLFNQEASERDPKAARRAFQYFADMVKRFPKSRYTPDAIKRMKTLRENLAKYEIHVAGYYMRRKAYLAAANRAKYVIENYSRTKAVPDALAMMVSAYRKLDLNDLADDALRVLKLNHPGHAATLESSQIKGQTAQ